jgi:hypothetical protein
MSDRDRLIELIKNAPTTDTVYGNIKLQTPIQTVQTIADHLLANDVIKIVRCKDCRYWQDKNSIGTQGICNCGEMEMSYGGEFYPLANDFCSYGELKEGNNNA